jgi:hypothetical protein
MRRLVTCLVVAFAAVTLASCSKDVPTARFECACQARNVAADNTRTYVLCESDGDGVHQDAIDQCELDFGADPGCECSCDRNGDC